MLKKIIIAILAYILGIVIIVILFRKERIVAFFALFLSIVFSIYIIWEVFSYYKGGWNKNSDKIVFSNLQKDKDITQLKKISSRPFFFGLESKAISDESFYFDDKDLFYIVAKDGKAIEIPFDQITELKKTSITINNVKIWQISVRIEGKDVVFRFAHNYNIWNNNFKEFYNRLSAKNPAVVKTKWSIWNI